LLISFNASNWSDDTDVGLMAIDVKNEKKIGAVWLKINER